MQDSSGPEKDIALAYAWDVEMGIWGNDLHSNMPTWMQNTPHGLVWGKTTVPREERIYIVSMSDLDCGVGFFHGFSGSAFGR